MVNNRKIVIIDDEEQLCIIIKKNFERAGGFDVAYALSGKDGIMLVESFKPDIVFLDLKLHDSSGIDLIKKILQINSKIKVAILSGMEDPLEAQEAFKAGAVDYITKPCSIGTLLEFAKKI